MYCAPLSDAGTMLPLVAAAAPLCALESAPAAARQALQVHSTG
jgi:hypothetical protein